MKSELWGKECYLPLATAPKTGRTGEENGVEVGGVQGGTRGFDNGCLNGRLGLTMIGENEENMVESENLNICSVVKKTLGNRKARHNQWVVSANNWA